MQVTENAVTSQSANRHENGSSGSRIRLRPQHSADVSQEKSRENHMFALFCFTLRVPRHFLWQQHFVATARAHDPDKWRRTLVGKDKIVRSEYSSFLRRQSSSTNLPLGFELVHRQHQEDFREREALGRDVRDSKPWLTRIVILALDTADCPPIRVSAKCFTPLRCHCVRDTSCARLRSMPAYGQTTEQHIHSCHC